MSVPDRPHPPVILRQLDAAGVAYRVGEGGRVLLKGRPPADLAALVRENEGAVSAHLERLARHARPEWRALPPYT